MAIPVYEIHALKYAERDGTRSDHFMGGDPHDADMPMDYFVWLIRNGGSHWVVDTGFNEDMAARRNRRFLRSPAQALALMEVDSATVPEVIVTHMHNDHVGAISSFPRARFHLQDREMAYVTGRHMRHGLIARAFVAEHVVDMVRSVFEDRVIFHDGEGEIAPGISVHRIGGHTAGLQCLRVHTRRGWVVLASDASNYYEHMETGRCSQPVFHVGEVLEGYAMLARLASSPEHIVPGHDPLIMRRYPPASPALEGIAASLHVPPAH
ncbi:MAG: N-acyl homoserine lactonase family protein [Burkholderiales bacterium]|nr:N-acyl homoserine lactonase family protein [Burkholderiales bacterium]